MNINETKSYKTNLMKSICINQNLILKNHYFWNAL